MIKNDTNESSFKNVENSLLRNFFGENPKLLFDRLVMLSYFDNTKYVEDYPLSGDMR